jgi:uncharacterized protein
LLPIAHAQWQSGTFIDQATSGMLMNAPDETPVNTTRLTDDEITQLEDHLASSIFAKQAMPLDQIQGFLCAVLSAPEEIPVSQWMPAVLGNPHYENEAQAEEVSALLMRFYEETIADLKEGESVGLLLHRDEGAAEDAYDYAAWCQAYLDGVDFSPVPWDEAGDEEEINELLFPISLLAEEIEPKALKQIKPNDMKELMQECREDLSLIVIDIFEYFLAVRNRPTTVRRDAPKVGRNDLCNCGSGKKFKLCCGAPAKLH